jgi:hypothetical protein
MMTGGDGAHQLRIEKALAKLPHETDALLDRLEASRSRRNEASYHASLVPGASLAEARGAQITPDSLRLVRRRRWRPTGEL